MTTDEAGQQNLRWYQGIPRYAWLVLIIAALGWLFDAMDQNLFNLVRQPSVSELLSKSGLTGKALDDTAKMWGGNLTAIFLLGWATGGFIFGILGDRLGRTRTMMITICIYALFTGLNGLVQTLPQYALCRFLTALGVGGEFAAGAALVAEVWPHRSRPMALGTLQALSAFGNMGAAVINLTLSNLGMGWRWVFAVGALPALMVVWIRTSVKEPEQWQEAKEQGGDELGRMSDLLRVPELRRNTIAGTLMALAGVGGVWGVAFFLPDLVGSVLKPLVAQSQAVLALPETARDAAVKKTITDYRSIVFFIQQVGAFCGMLVYAALSERMGRRPALAIFFVAAFLSVQVTFWGLRDLTGACLLALPLGFCALAPFSAYAVYFPELYPTRLRATGVGFCYNCARILAALAPFALGALSKQFSSPSDPTHGFRMAASIVACIYVVGFIGLAIAPETRGKALPQ
jgi:MFS family permease